MRTVEVTRFVSAPRAVVDRELEPAGIVELEGSFHVLDREERDDGVYVTAGGGGMAMTLRFDRQEDGWRYEQRGKAGPFDDMWTEVSTAAENEGTRVRFESGVSLGLPVAGITDRIAAWKRRGELRRALSNLAVAVE
ncbi:MAG: SRPBCC family protein [Halobacteriales archaeon]